MGKKKPAKDLTTDEAMKKLFPGKVVRELKKVAHEKDDKPKRKHSKPRKKK